MTYPHIGNYGINEEDVESGRPYMAGFVVRENQSHRQQFSLDRFAVRLFGSLWHRRDRRDRHSSPGAADSRMRCDERDCLDRNAERSGIGGTGPSLPGAGGTRSGQRSLAETYLELGPAAESVVALEQTTGEQRKLSFSPGRHGFWHEMEYRSAPVRAGLQGDGGSRNRNRRGDIATGARRDFSVQRARRP